jgi:hypothetical protein
VAQELWCLGQMCRRIAMFARLDALIALEDVWQVRALHVCGKGRRLTQTGRRACQPFVACVVGLTVAALTRSSGADADETWTDEAADELLATWSLLCACMGVCCTGAGLEREAEGRKHG